MLSHVFHFLFIFVVILASRWLTEIWQLGFPEELACKLRFDKEIINAKIANLIVSHLIYLWHGDVHPSQLPEFSLQVESVYHQRTGLQHKKKTMDNEKVKRNRNAYKDGFCAENNRRCNQDLIIKELDYNTRTKQWTTKKQMPTELLCRKLPKQRFKKKITKSLFQIFLKLVNYVNWYRYAIEWNEKNLKFIFLAIMLETT